MKAASTAAGSPLVEAAAGAELGTEGDSLPRSSADSQALKASKTLKRKTVDNLEVAAIIRWNLSSVARIAQDPLWHYAPCSGE